MPGSPRPLTRSNANLRGFSRFLRPAWALFSSALALSCTGAVGGTAPGQGSPAETQAGTDNGSTGGTPSGTGGASGTPSTTSRDVSFACDAAQKQPVASLRRLTMVQYRNTLRDLISGVLTDAQQATSVMTELSSAIAELPSDAREPVPQDLHGSYRRLDQSLQQTHVDAIYDVAVAAGAALTTTARLGQIVGKCATDTDASNDATCLSSFLATFGARALRRPLTTDDLSLYSSVYGADTKANAAAYADVIAVFLNAPEFVYFAEHGASEVPGKSGVFSLTAYEVASRLAYQLWQTAPDDELTRVAADGSLTTDSVFNAQIDRMIRDQRARPALDEFFSDWVKAEDLPALDAKVQDPVFKAFAGADLPGAGLRQAMIDDVLGMLDYYTWTKPAGFQALLTSQSSFARAPALAKIYGLPAWDGLSTPPSFPDGQRPGLLTRALFLSSGSPNTRPILKGVFIRKHILCDDIPPPPPGANAMPPELRSDMTTRQVVEELTEKPGTVCAGCHAGMINPLGFATENFDALGRFRSAQRLFDDAGNVVGEQPVATASVPRVFSNDMTPSSGTTSAMTMIGASGKAEACLSRNYFRFTYARWEDPAVDGCALEAYRKALLNGGKVSDLIKAATMTPEFRQRTFE